MSNLRNHKGIKIKDDVSKAVEMRQAALRPALVVARKIDKKTRFVQDKILHRGQLYGINNIHEMPCDISTAYCKQADGKTIFAGELTALSNLHPCTVVIDGVKYKSTEHYFQYMKCKEQGQHQLASDILKVENPREAMIMGKAVHTDMTWIDTRGVEIMKKAVTAKFSDKHLGNILSQTNGEII